jgi:hypothetical protein
MLQRGRSGSTGAPQNPLAAGGNIGERVQNTFASPTQRGIADFYAQLFAPGGMDRFSGQGVLDAAQPLFQRNLADALATQREAGPRFASGQNVLAGQTSERALQDFNLFSQNVLQQGQNTALQALAGAQNFGGQQQELLSQLLSALFTGGGINAPAQFQRTPGFLESVLPLAGTALGTFGLPNPFGGGGGRSASGQGSSR